MNKKNNRKGFTTVELIIVIAVIAILATVLIPTFSNLISKAEESNALQAASSTFKNYTIDNATSFSKETIYVVIDGEYVFKIDKGEWNEDKKPEVATKEKPVEIPCGAVVIKNTNDDAGFASAGNADLPDHFSIDEHTDANSDKKCDTCTKALG